MLKKVFITGICGQDGIYLTKLLQEKGYEVFGIDLPDNKEFEVNATYVGLKKLPTISLIPMSAHNKLKDFILDVRPNEFYNFAAMSSVAASWIDPISTLQTNTLDLTFILDIIRKNIPTVRFYQASSSEMLGIEGELTDPDILTPSPKSPYAVSKLASFYLTKLYREAYNMFIANGIVFNHESPIRPLTYVTRKITHAAAKIKLGLQEYLYLGNLDIQRDFGFAGDYVMAMYLMLQQSKPRDYIICTGRFCSLEDICKIAFGHVGLNYQDYIRLDTSLLRPKDLKFTSGNPIKSKEQLQWSPTTTLEKIIQAMVDRDLDLNSHQSNQEV